MFAFHPRTRAHAFSARTLAALAAVALVLPLSACDSGEDGGELNEADVTVMTRNLYLGADLFVLLGAETPQQVPPLAAQLYAQVLASDFPSRAAAIAAEVDAHDPDLIGLQEVVLYRTQTPSDYVTGTTTPNATTIGVDFLAELEAALTARGLNYTVVATNVNADVELPSTTNGTDFTDIRLTDSDVILARNGVTTSNPVERRFIVAAPIPIGGSTIDFFRGFSHVRATVDDVTFTFANAHLEVGGDAVQAQILQASEFKAAMNQIAGPILVAGDFNSDPTDTGLDGESYRVLTNTQASLPLSDAWSVLGTGPGNTCCQAADLRNATSELTSRIDLLLSRGDVTPLSIEVIGEEPGDRTPGGLWPSDHAGVVGTFRVRSGVAS